MKPKSRTAGIATILAAVVLLMSGYFAAYSLCSRGRANVGNQAHRDTVVIFSRNWQAELFKPAAAIESLLRRKNVETFSQEAMDGL